MKNKEKVNIIENISGEFDVSAKQQCEEFARYLSNVYVAGDGYLLIFDVRCDNTLGDLRDTVTSFWLFSGVSDGLVNAPTCVH